MEFGSRKMESLRFCLSTEEYRDATRNIYSDISSIDYRLTYTTIRRTDCQNNFDRFRCYKCIVKMFILFFVN